MLRHLPSIFGLRCRRQALALASTSASLTSAIGLSFGRQRPLSLLCPWSALVVHTIRKRGLAQAISLLVGDDEEERSPVHLFGHDADFVHVNAYVAARPAEEAANARITAFTLPSHPSKNISLISPMSSHFRFSPFSSDGEFASTSRVSEL